MHSIYLFETQIFDLCRQFGGCLVKKVGKETSFDPQQINNITMVTHVTTSFAF